MSEVLSRLLPAGLEWARPWGLLALLLPLAVLLASLRPELPEPRVTGAIALWRHVRSAGSGGRARLVLPLARVLWILALVLGALALAGPHPQPPTPAWSLAVVVDPSPSMGLRHPDGGTRGEAALELLERWLEDQEPVALERFDGTRLGSLDELLDRRPGAAAGGAGGITDWSPYDRPGTAWITDDGRGLEPVFAGLCAAGGTPVPGAVAALGADRWWWDGASFGWREDAGPAGELVVVGRVPAPILELARLWAEERGWSLVEVAERGAGGAPAAPGRGGGLVLVAHPGAAGSVQPVGRDGWTAEVRAVQGGVDVGPGSTEWLPGMVWWRAGRVDLGIASVEGEVRGPGAFVMSWADLLDGAVSVASDVLPAEERAGAGEPRFQPPQLARVGARGGGRGQGEQGTGEQVPAWLAAAGVVLGVAALALSGFARTL